MGSSSVLMSTTQALCWWAGASCSNLARTVACQWTQAPCQWAGVPEHDLTFCTGAWGTQLYYAPWSQCQVTNLNWPGTRDNETSQIQTRISNQKSDFNAIFVPISELYFQFGWGEPTIFGSTLNPNKIRIKTGQYNCTFSSLGTGTMASGNLTNLVPELYKLRDSRLVQFLHTIFEKK